MIEKEYTAKTVEEAIALGLEELNITAEQAIIDIIEEKKSLFKKSATIKITVIDEPSSQEKSHKLVAKSFGEKDAACNCKKDDKSTTTDEENISATAQEESSKNSASCDTENKPVKPLHENDKFIVDYVTELIDKMGLDCTLTVKSNREVLTIIIGGADVNYAIGYRGETLDNIQYLSLLTANKKTRYKKKLIIDAEGYRELRAEQLALLSKKLAYKVAKNNTSIELEPMNPFERRVIHTTLQEDKYVTTSSEGTEPNRYVVISPVKKEDLMYDLNTSRKFKQEGIKTRSFGQKQKRF